MVLMGNKPPGEALNRVFLGIDLAPFVPVSGFQKLFPAGSVGQESGKVVLPRDKFIGLFLEDTPWMEHLQPRIGLLVEGEAGFDPAFLARPQMGKRSVPR
jgi:hypothetical protein